MASSRRVRLSLAGFRPLERGEGGYSKSKRLQINPGTGEVISRREFVKRAERIPYISPVKPAKPRQIRQEQGKLTRAKTSAKALKQYRQLVDIYKNNVNEVMQQMNLPLLTHNDIRQSKEFQMYFKAYKNYKDRQKGGLRHQALILFGVLEEEDDYY